MESTDAHSSRPPPTPPPPSYDLPAASISPEDILFCVDVGPESLMEMKIGGPSGRPTRLEAIKQAILLFVHSKLTINPDHRFAFAVLSKSAHWIRKEFSSEVDSVMSALRSITPDPTPGQPDLTQLFKAATHEAKKSRAQDRILRVILLYCRSSAPPQFSLPTASKLFTLDAMYLHDKPGPDNCPQLVYDTLVEAVERVSEFEGYIFETGQGLTRILFRFMCVLLSHPQQRCLQDEAGLPKSLTKKSPPAEPGQGAEVIII